MTGPGRPSTGTPIHVRIPADVLAEVDKRAAMQRTTRAAIVRDLLALAVGHNPAQRCMACGADADVLATMWGVTVGRVCERHAAAYPPPDA